MTQAQLIRAVAGATGESPRTLRRLGFTTPKNRSLALEPEDLRLAVDCPFCGRPTELVAGPGGLPGFAECARCDVAFNYPATDIQAVSARALDASPLRPLAS